jgi:hypothetical protein
MVTRFPRRTLQSRYSQLIMSDHKSSHHTPLNPKTSSYEFLGPPGALAITLGVPVLTYVLYFTCNESSGGCPPPIQSLYPSLAQAVSDPAFWWKLWDPKAFTIYYSWYAFCLVAWAVLPGDWVQGTQLRNGKYQQYKINGTILCPTHSFFDLKLTDRVSVFHMPYGPWPLYWLHLTLWSRVVHVLL